MTVFISEFKESPGGPGKFIEVVTTDGEDISGYSIAIYDETGALRQSLPFGSQDATAGGDRAGYVIDGSDGLDGAFSNDWSFAIIDDTGAVLQFIGVGSPPAALDGPAAGMAPTPVPGTTAGSNSTSTHDGGATYSTGSNSKGTIPCFAPGTLIDTPQGRRPVETLGVGDRVTTRLGGTREIIWCSNRAQPLTDLGSDQRPVLIRKGALGFGKPAQDLVVSPQHRILVGACGQFFQAFPEPALVPAKSLTDLPGIRFMPGRKDIAWHHFAFHRHDVVFANGCATESLLLGPMVLRSMTRAEVRRLLRHFPDLAPQAAGLNGPPAYPILSPGRVQQILQARQGGRPRREPADTAGQALRLASGGLS